MKTIVLIPEDIPNKLQLMHAASRLAKDYEMLSKIRGKNDVEDPQSMIAAASFLDMLVRRESKNLKRGEMSGDRYVSSLEERFVSYLLALSSDEAIEVINSLRDKISGNHSENM